MIVSGCITPVAQIPMACVSRIQITKAVARCAVWQPQRMGSPGPGTMFRARPKIRLRRASQFLGLSTSGWGAKDGKCRVMKTNGGYERLYHGSGAISFNSATEKFGYATSEGGVNWINHPGNPILQSNIDLLSRQDRVLAPSALIVGPTFYLYYSYFGQAMVGAATGTKMEP